MNEVDIINDAYTRAEEYVELVSNPYQFISHMLAKQILSLKEEIEYLKKVKDGSIA